MREKLTSVGDDYWDRGRSGSTRLQGRRQALRIRDTFVLRDAGGAELAEIQERKLRVRDSM